LMLLARFGVPSHNGHNFPNALLIRPVPIVDLHVRSLH
jgi:hypothetical protein